MQAQAKLLNTAVDQATAKLVAPLGLAPKYLARIGDLTAIACWGGKVLLIDATGAVKSTYRMPQDVTAMTAQNDHLFFGLADGEIVAFTTP